MITLIITIDFKTKTGTNDTLINVYLPVICIDIYADCYTYSFALHFFRQ